MPRFALPVDTGEASSDESSDDEELEEQPGEAEQPEDDAEQAEDEAEEPAAEAGPSSPPAGRKKIQLKLGSKDKIYCHVCGKAGHNAGFVGVTYVDCPNRPCYLCKQPGHTTATCPYRPEEHPNHKLRWQVDAAVLKLHSRRCTCLEFHPTRDNLVLSGDKKGQLHSRRCTCLEFHPMRDNLVLSGDKKGQVAIWDWQQVHERSVYQPHRALTNNVKFGDSNTAITAGTDGLLKTFDIETGLTTDLINLNPEGWIQGVSTEKNWHMLYGLDVCKPRSLAVAGDTKGNLHMVDYRCPGEGHTVIQAHKRGDKVTSVHVNPADPNILASASNDWNVRIFDIRAMPTGDTTGTTPPAARKRSAPAAAELGGWELCSLPHPKVVNSAYFSPSGRKLLTTCIDNRLRVWDSWLGQGAQPSRSLVHSHDFNRYLTPFRAEWDPKDHTERMIVCGRYISEVFGGLALHPVDLLDAGTGRHLAELTDPNLTTISPVNKPHPRQDVIISGSSRSLYAWRPVESEAEAPAAAASAAQAPVGSASFVFFECKGDGDDGEKKKRKKKGEAADSDEDAAPSKAKSSKARKKKE